MFEKTSVFSLLARMRQIKKSVENGCAPLEAAMWVNQEKLLKDSAPRNNLGDRIEQEFYEQGELTEEQAELAMEYFEEDFTKSYGVAREYLKEAEENTIEHNLQLTRALGLFQRAQKDIERIMLICPGQSRLTNCFSLEEISACLGEDMQKAYFMLEFPDLWKMMLPLHLQMIDAVKRENYEFAQFLRQGLDSIVRNNNPY
jgi:hypothetical protein